MQIDYFLGILVYMKEYDHLKIERKWQKEWEKKKVYSAQDLSKKPKFYGLIEFPYPSGDGLHVGHIRSNTAMDIIARKRRAQGFNVLYPIGWDAFGLPTENYAIKTGIAPAIVTKKNTDTFRRQLKALGFSFDWSREINTTDPKYYKWTQWIFLQLLKHDLAYKAKINVNWCPKDKTGLANEEVVDGCCERCGTPVEKREKDQWLLRITKYADRLDKDLDTVDYLEKIKIQQRNWIGKSEGMIFTAPVKDTNLKLQTFSAHFEGFRADTFVVIAPDHPFLKELIKGTQTEKKVLAFADTLVQERLKENYENKELKGIFTGRYIVDPVGNGDLPIWVASFALADYGTGMVKCSAHDERDFAFAKKYNIKLKEVFEPLFIDKPDLNLPFVERNAISAIVKHWNEDKYLGLKWKKVDWGTFITGGVEKGQTPEEAARAEIREETGFLNLKLAKTLPNSHSKFYHAPKKENRFAHFFNFYFELKDGEQVEITEEEKEKHDIVWLSPNEVEKFLTPEGQKRDWKILQGKEKPILDGILTEPKEFAGREVKSVRKEIIEYLEKNNLAKRKTTYKLRDWVFSRQRYWGEPIPVVNCEKCGIVALSEKDLPLKLPKLNKYQPTDDGESPLARATKWVNTKCPKCKGPAKRETDTMPNWAGSSWYYLAYTMQGISNFQFPISKYKKVFKYWMPVDWYNGGMEHTTLHLLYSRFWHKFLFDIGVIPTSEPYKKRTSHGLILAGGGVKMSKSKGNVINPDAIIKTYGADSLRLYEMFMGPFGEPIPWGEENIIGVRRFLEKVWKISEKILVKKISSGLTLPRVLGGTHTVQKSSLPKLLNKTIKKVSEDIETMHFNTAISSMMILANEMERQEFVSQKEYELFLKILSPFAPHITEEIWHSLGYKTLLVLEKWPAWDENLIKDEEVKIAVQVNGKVRAEIIISMDAKEEDVKKQALADPAVLKYVAGKDVQKIIYIKNRLINIVF